MSTAALIRAMFKAGATDAVVDAFIADQITEQLRTKAKRRLRAGMAVNPRALGVNPRAIGTNPRSAAK